MKRALLVLASAAACACSTKTPPKEAAVAPAALQFAADGTVRSLRFDGGALWFCDARGSHRADLSGGPVTGDNTPCPPPQEPNAGCGIANLDVSVRSPQSEPNDIVDLKTSSFPLTGRVHDCAAAGNHLVVGTGSAVFLIDTVKNTMKTISSDGSDRVAVSENWVAWVEASSVHMARAD
jgi:hypothetical protein